MGARARAATMTACAAMVTSDGTRLIAPRPCVRPAKDGSPYCGFHASPRGARGRLRGSVALHEGGFCIVCADAAHTYVIDGTRIALCARHGQALSVAIAGPRG